MAEGKKKKKTTYVPAKIIMTTTTTPLMPVKADIKLSYIDILVLRTDRRSPSITSKTQQPFGFGVVSFMSSNRLPRSQAL